jgi:hypothetical protein
MFKNKKFSLITIGALLMVLALGLVAFAPIDTASAATPDEDGFSHGRRPNGFKPDRGGDGEALAEALGISVEELEAAHQSAQSAAIEQALADGLITQAQADRLLNGNFKAFQMMVGPDSTFEMDVYLAQALGISTDQLSAARQAVKDAAIKQALADGKITEEQVEMMEARQALQNYMQKDEMLAKALGITLDELDAAKEDGQRIPDLLETLGIEPEEFQANMEALREEILTQAVEDGLITQEQADQMLEDGFGGMRSPGGGDRYPGDKDSTRRRPGRGGSGGSDFQLPGQSTGQG